MDRFEIYRQWKKAKALVNQQKEIDVLIRHVEAVEKVGVESENIKFKKLTARTLRIVSVLGIPFGSSRYFLSHFFSTERILMLF